MKDNTHLRNLAAICLTILVLAVPGLSRADVSFNRIFIFGDSLSDPGNIYALTGETSKAPYALIPSAPYAIGGHQFSNGKTWAQRFAQNMRLNSSGKAALDAPGTNGNYAFGGARARTDSGSLAPDASTQIGLYLSSFGSADSNALYVIEFGGNDLRDALVAAFTDPTGATSASILQAGVETTIQNILSLYAGGAKQFMVASVPNLALAPAVRLGGPEAIFAAGFFASSYNQGLELGLVSLETILPDISIERLDIFGFTNDVVAAPEDFGITESDAPCLKFGAEGNVYCQNPYGYIFWDGIHPTATIHTALGDVATALVNDHDH